MNSAVALTAVLAAIGLLACDNSESRIKKATCLEADTLEIGVGYRACLEDEGMYRVATHITWRTKSYLADKLFQGVAPDLSPRPDLVAQAQLLSAADIRAKASSPARVRLPDGVYAIEGHLEWESDYEFGGGGFVLRDNYGLHDRTDGSKFSIDVYVDMSAGISAALKNACQGLTHGGANAYECSGRFYVSIKSDSPGATYVFPRLLAIEPTFSNVPPPPYMGITWRRLLSTVEKEG